MDTWQPEPELLTALDDAVPAILASQKDNGQFGTEPWISTDQNVLLALAAAWSLEHSVHYHSAAVLDAIVRGGYAIQDAQDEAGMVLFRKKDHSTWGQIYMPWVYSRWIRAYALVRDAMDEAARQRWDEGLQLGYDGIARTALTRVHNIPTHHAMGLYCAGQVFGRTDWQRQAAAFLHRVVDAQDADGWWAEHEGPVVAYNLVYAESLGVYCAFSGDDRVLDALTRAARYHAACVYPDGALLETVDGRNPYHQGVRLGNVGFSLTPEGRGFLQQQHALHLQAGGAFDADYAAHMLLYGGSGHRVQTSGAQKIHIHTMGPNGDKARIHRQQPWFTCLSAFTAPQTPNRFGQDRQNFFSIYHDAVGLIAGGGNTKLQPLWSSFTLGDTALLRHTPGDEDPDFSPPAGLVHLPDAGRITDEGVLALDYGPVQAQVTLDLQGDKELIIGLAADGSDELPIEAHMTLIARLGQPLASSERRLEGLDATPFEWSDPGWIAHGGWRLEVPPGSRALWPVLPHNPYRKDGAATLEEARLVLALPLANGAPPQRLRLIVEA